jgi:molybdate transport system substrate-binding protein
LKTFVANGVVAATTVKTIAKVAYIDPAAGGSSGIDLDPLFRKMGLFDMIQPKAVLVPGGLVAPLPEAIQNYTVYAAALSVPGCH